jgi:hypothetical protein
MVEQNAVEKNREDLRPRLGTLVYKLSSAVSAQTIDYS